MAVYAQVKSSRRPYRCNCSEQPMTTKSLSLGQVAVPRSMVACRLAIVLLASLAGIAPAVASDVDDFKCGPLKPPGQFGPYDYRTANKDVKEIVEIAHFSRENELIMRGTSTTLPGPDLDYTLRAFPNHARALK